MAEESPVTLFNLADGAAAELFDEELSRVVANILDPNTDAECVREIALKIKIKPDSDRGMGSVAVQVTSKMGPVRGVGTRFFFGRKAGKFIALENNPKQLTFDDNLKAVVNIRTGEVVE